MAEQSSDEQKAIVPAGSRTMAVHDYAGYEDQGFEHAGAADVTVPLITLQTFMSPAVKEGRAKPGDWLNSVTGEILDGRRGWLMVPATTRHYIARWAVPRGSGFRGHLMPEDPLVLAAQKRHEEYRKTHDEREDKKARFGKMWSADGKEDWVDTRYIYCIPCSDEGEPLGFALIPHSSTKIQVYRNWQTTLQFVRIKGGKKPPMFSHLIRVTSFLDKNTRGEEFHVPVYSPADPRGIIESMLTTEDPRFLAGFHFKQLVDRGAAKEDFAAQQETEGDETEGGGTGGASLY